MLRLNKRLPRAARGFTLLEILVVISIIAILAGLIIPSFYSAKRRARTATAQSEVKHLETAFKAYLDTYKVWLFSSSIDEVTAYDVADNGGLNLFSMLRGADATLNPQAIAFYEFKSTTNYPSQTTAYDPWSDPYNPSSFKAYQVMFDKDYDNKITINGKEVYRSVLVWSYGEGRTNDYGEGDDVASWK